MMDGADDMTNFRQLVFVKNATNTYGRFVKGDRAQARFPQELIASYLEHGILQQVDEPVTLDATVKRYKTQRKPKT